MAKQTPWMESPNCKAFIDGKNVEVHLKGMRLSFCHLFEPQEHRDDRTKEVTGFSYSANILVPKENAEDTKLIAAAQKKAIELCWGENKPTITEDKRCFRNGEPKDPDTDLPTARYDGYAGMNFLSANRRVDSKDAPNPVQLLDSRKGPDGKFPRLKKDSGKLYAGSFADIIVRIYGYDPKGKPGQSNRVNASLEAAKFVKHGQAFGAKAVDADAAFDEEEDDDMDGQTSGSDFQSDDDDDLLG